MTKPSMTKPSMTKPAQQLVFFLVLALLAFASTGCNASISFGDSITGSGELVSQSYDVEDFDSVRVEDSYDVVVLVGEAIAVEVLADDNLIDELDIRVRNGELQLAMRSGLSLNRGTLEVTVRMPQLDELEVSGASTTEVLGVAGSSLDLEVSGASDLRVEGSANMVTLDASGASDVQLRLSDVKESVIDLSGASSVTMLSSDSVRGEMSGASDLTVPDGADVDVDRSGASSVSRG